MATLTADVKQVYELGDINEIPVIASDIIYEGAAAGIDGSGNAQPLTTNDEFAGFTTAQADNSAGIAGAKNVKVRPQGLIELTVAGAAAASIGAAVYASDDATFTLTKAAGLVKIGYVHRFVSSGVAVVAFAASQLQTAIADPSGGATVDAEARTAIGSIIDAMEVAGILFPA